jgi:DNA-binding response OmpR family regulator
MALRRDPVTERTTGHQQTRDRSERATRARSEQVLFVVEDDLSTLDLLRDVAEECGWKVRAFTRLREFNYELRVRRPDLVILDDDLPDGSGGDRAREMGVDERLTDVPVLVCTAAHPVRQAEIGSWAPVLSKPFELRAIERFLRAAGGGDGMGQRAAG